MYGAPETYLIDKQGIIRHKIVVVVDQKVWRAQLAPLYQQLLDGAGGPMKRFLVTALLGLALCGVARAAIDTYEFASATPSANASATTQELRTRSARTRTSPTPTHRSPTCAQANLRPLQQGKSDGEIVDYMVARYGDFVRYKPPVNERTWLLWFGPGACCCSACW